MTITRRDFVAGSAAVAAMAALPVPALRAGEIMPRNGRRVVVVGGGWGGTTAAKYIRLGDPSIEVVMIEREPVFRSCPTSNWVIGGFYEMDDLTRSYDALASRHEVKIVHDSVRGIDPAARTVTVGDGDIHYDRLILSPGITLRHDAIEGMDDAGRDRFPAAWKAGDETVVLRERLQAMEPGGTVVVTVPLGPYRCPPGPYERISLIASYLKAHKPGSRLVVFDANQNILSKTGLFRSAWDELYADIIDYRPDHRVARVDPSTGMIYSDFDEIQADVGNIVPPQQANQLAFDAGLVPEGRSWVPVDPWDFTATEQADVHVVGDAVDATTVGPIPKSGFITNSMAKVAAAAAVALLNDREPTAPTLANTCYSLVSPEEGISVTNIYGWDEESRKMVQIDAASGLSPGRSPLIARHAADWALAIWNDMLA